MACKVLLLEPDYKNKYPPMGLMKLATYFRGRGDDVHFFKGDLKSLGLELIFEDYWKTCRDPSLGEYTPDLRQYIKDGKRAHLENIPDLKIVGDIQEARKKFKNADYPKFDIVCVTTLFTFYWKKTTETINAAKKFLAAGGRILVGGIASTILYNEFRKETGISPYLNSRGGALLDRPGQIDPDSPDIIDELPLDYSLLDETDYKYPAKDAYLAYTTRGCVNHCGFCAVPRLEPAYCGFRSIKKQIEQSAERFGERKDLLLLDNNVLASRHFNAIIDEIKDLGFARGALCQPSNEYSIAIKNIRDNYNARTYIRKIIRLYDDVSKLLPEDEKGRFYLEREARGLLYADTATAQAILDLDAKFAPMFEKYVYSRIRSKGGCVRSVDFNQGLDARLLTEEKMKKLAEINIVPMRIAFDHWDIDPLKPEDGPMRDIYKSAVQLAAKYGIRQLSNYLLYNTDHDLPEELYYRMRMNVDLCEELNIRIYSFPMKYHPIDDPEYFMNRNYTGTHWNRKYIRAIQAILNSTHGMIGQGRNFFEAAFGKDIDRFSEILLMPETFIIERYKYDSGAYELYLSQGGKRNPLLTPEVVSKYGGMADKWRQALASLSPGQKTKILPIIESNTFARESIAGLDAQCREVMEFYLIKSRGESPE